MAGSVGTAILTGAVGQGAGSLVVPTIDAGKGIYSYLKLKYGYIRNLDENFENLAMEARYLFSRKQDVDEKIKQHMVMMDKTRECTTWLEDVAKIKQKFEDLGTRYENVVNGSCGLCQFRTRLKLSEKILKITKIVVDLKDRMNLEHVLLTERLPERVEKKFPPKINEVPSLQGHVETLLEYLKDDSIKKIGVWGMSGVGKTTILENLNDEVEKLRIFDIVLMVTVSKEGSLCQIRQDILTRLNEKVEGISTERQTTVISKSLENKKYLLLLDEVSEKFSLRHIGIYDNHLHGKVVLTTRERVICNWMETDEEIKVERLSRDDARKLFRDAVGVAVDHPHIKPIAERVLKQCGEVPLIIRAVGNHLKDKLNEDLWHNTLSKLRSPNLFQLKHMEDVFNVFKVIYEELHDTLKRCLLYGASFPEDHEIYRDYLIECWKAEKLIGNDVTLRKAREEGHANLEILIDRCLLDGCRGKKCVKMPIIFRNTALKMADEHEFGLLVKDTEDLETCPPIEKWAYAKVISLIGSDIETLPKRPCSKVSTLFLQKNKKLCMIPTPFFECMSSLRILDVCGSGISYLPPSISVLADLRGLYLNDCLKLDSLPDEVKHLHKIEVLDICRSGICGLPVVLGELTSLQCLRVSFTSSKSIQNHVEANGIDTISPKVIENLQELEELSIDADPMDPKWNKIAPIIIKEVAKLGKLSTLVFHFSSIECLESFTQISTSWKNGTFRPGNSLRSFHFVVGSCKTKTLQVELDVSKCSSHRYLQYAGGNNTPDVIKEVLSRACAFELISHRTISNLSDFGIDVMECLELCLVKECTEMTSIIRSNVPPTPAFPWLRELHLCSLPKLNEICQGSVCPGSFTRLTTLTVYNCPKLIRVVSLDAAKQFSELQHLRVDNCSQMTEIVGFDAQCNGKGALFPKLKILELVMLEGLVSIHSNDLFEWRELQKVEIIECYKLANLCFNTKNAVKLCSIRCNEGWWRQLVLNEQVKAHLQGICCFC